MDGLKRRAAGVMVKWLALALLSALLSALVAAPANAQTLRSNLRDDVPNVDPAAFNGVVGNRLLALVYEGLTAFAADGGVAPALATRWETPDQGRTWRFHLRPGVRFHSGRPLTAADVEATFRAVLKARRPSLSAPFLDKLVGRDDFVNGRSDRLSGFVAVDSLTFDLRFTTQVATFPFYPFFIFDSGAPAQWGADWHGKHSGGTGPFRLASWRRGQEARLEANPDYWGPRPAIDLLRLLAVPSVETALAMFEAGELDFVTVSEPAHRLVASNPRYRDLLQVAPRKQMRFIGMNGALYPPFADPRVRKAVSLAIDRRAVIDGVYGGLAVMAPGYGVASLAPDAAAGEFPVIAHEYDPEAAQRLLAEAGYPGGRGLPPVEMTVLDSLRTETSYYAAQMSAVLGMSVKLRVLDRAGMNSAANAGTLPLFAAGWTADFPEPLTYLEALWHSASPFNQIRWRDPAYDALIDAARQSVGDSRRRALYRQAEQRLSDSGVAAMLPTPMNILLRHDNAKSVSITPFGHLAFVPRRAAGHP